MFFSLLGLSTRQLREVLLQLQAVDVTLSVIHDVVTVIQAFLNEHGGNMDGAQAALDGVQVIGANEDIPEEDSKCIYVLICKCDFAQMIKCCYPCPPVSGLVY